MATRCAASVSKLLRSSGNCRADFQAWLLAHPVWANSLVDRIVPEALAPAGAVAEPYALWAIERQPRLVLPRTHPAIVVTDQSELTSASCSGCSTSVTPCSLSWLRAGQPPGMTVLDAMRGPGLAHSRLQGVRQDEALPVFEALLWRCRTRLSRR